MRVLFVLSICLTFTIGVGVLVEKGVLFELEHCGESLDLVKHMHIDQLCMIIDQYLHISKVDPQH